MTDHTNAPLMQDTELQRLAALVREAVSVSGSSDAERAAAVTDAITDRLPTSAILTPEQRLGSADGYQQHVLHVEPDGAFSIVALVWRPGQATPIHDHLCWCVVAVIQGSELETRYEVTDAERRLVREVDGTVNPPGAVCGLAPPGDVHRVGAGDGPTISLHVYGADISTAGSSIRRCYELG